MESNRRDALDTIVESALRSYSQAEPLDGLEERILNRARAAKTKRSAAWMRPLAVTCLTAVLCISVFAVLHSRKLSTPKISTFAENRKPSLPSFSSLTLPVSAPPRRVATFRHQRTRRRFAKQEQFPMREPLTAEERTLVRFVDRDPKQAAEEFASLHRKTEAAVVIQPLEITRLEADGPSK